MKPFSFKIYLTTLALTATIFFAAFLSSAYFNKKKTEEIKAAEDKVAIDILSLETQYDLLTESSCKTFSKQALRQELDDLASKLAFMESQVGYTNPDVSRLKRYYSILEIKDYLLTKKMSEQCKIPTVFILYFYSNNNCTECRTQEFMLKAVREKYPEIEIYTFDYDLDLVAVKTLISLHNIPNKPPVIDINGKAYASFPTLEDMEAILEPLVNQAVATTTPKTTKTPAQ